MHNRLPIHNCTVGDQRYLYSARLYRNIQREGSVSAVFCMCLYQSAYTEVIVQGRTQDFEKGGSKFKMSEGVGEECHVPSQNSPLGGSGGMPPQKILGVLIVLDCFWCHFRRNFFNP